MTGCGREVVCLLGCLSDLFGMQRIQTGNVSVFLSLVRVMVVLYC